MKYHVQTTLPFLFNLSIAYLCHHNLGMQINFHLYIMLQHLIEKEINI